MSRVMRNPTFCICENKEADQLRGNREADQRLCFRYTDSTIPLLSKSEISNLEPSSVAAQPGLCQTIRIHIVGFLMTRLKYYFHHREVLQISCRFRCRKHHMLDVFGFCPIIILSAHHKLFAKTCIIFTAVPSSYLSSSC